VGGAAQGLDGGEEHVGVGVAALAGVEAQLRLGADGPEGVSRLGEDLFAVGDEEDAGIGVASTTRPAVLEAARVASSLARASSCTAWGFLISRGSGGISTWRGACGSSRVRVGRRAR
jgi:hypothetical protein